MTRRGQARAESPGTFSDQVASEHRRIDADAWADIYVVGDVHGCRRTFERLLDRLDVGPDDLVVCVGDVVRKGPDSKGALALVRERENVLTVRGNNEQGLLDGSKSDPALDAEDLSYIETLPLAISWEDVLVVHGGIDHREPLSEHAPEDVLNTRSLTGGGYERPYWFERRSERPQVFFGHTVLAEAFETPYAVGLDTGCVYGGELTAYDWRAGEFVTVEPPETYRSRSDDSIVSPRPAEPVTE
ncbi:MULTISPECIES: metallophosphoesterase family protein [Salinibaculum]|uniref:metallophosphoesterase family protein n=1 Tax=Salinibaculum TaxID=2732368 RepID=UPI0030D4905D